MPSRGDPADDWLLGFSGRPEEAETIKGLLGEFLWATFHLTLSQPKTLITNLRTEAARFLGYEIINQHADDKQHRAYDGAASTAPLA